MSYVPDATDPTEPLITRKASSAAAEFRAIKQRIIDVLAACVQLTGNQTVAGTKTFSSLPEVSADPTNGNQLVRKAYADALSWEYKGTIAYANIDEARASGIYSVDQGSYTDLLLDVSVPSGAARRIQLLWNYTDNWCFRVARNTPTEWDGVVIVDQALLHTNNYANVAARRDGSNATGNWAGGCTGTAAAALKSSVPRRTSGWADGECLETTTSQTLESADVVQGRTYMLLNDSNSTWTLIQGSGVTLRLAGTMETGSLTIDPHALVTIRCKASGVAVVAGAGVRK